MKVLGIVLNICIFYWLLLLQLEILLNKRVVTYFPKFAPQLGRLRLSLACRHLFLEIIALEKPEKKDMRV